MKIRKKAVILAGVMSLALGAAGAANAKDYLFASGSQGGSWFPLAGAIKGIVEEKNKGITLTVQPGAGIANVVGISKGKFPIAFANSTSTVDGIKGRPPFKAPAKNVCNLGVLYPQYFQIVATKSSGIDSLAKIKGAKLTTQPNGNTGELLTRKLLGFLGLSYKDMASVSYLSYKDSVTQMKDGNANLFTLGTAVPAGAIMDIASSRKITLVPVTKDIFAKFKAENDAFQLLTIKAGSYPGVDKDVPAVGYHTHMIAACNAPDELVTAVLSAVADNLKTLSSVNKNLATLTLDVMSADIGVPMHKAAAAFYASRK
ncbi:MAG: TAXI family TRAP transporter solute-binding subunit [Methyloligellaceae bacterium]